MGALSTDSPRLLPVHDHNFRVVSAFGSSTALYPKTVHQTAEFLILLERDWQPGGDSQRASPGS